MKKIYIFLLTMVILISLCGCSSSANTTYTVTKDGTDFIVDPENSTISDGVNTYQYTFSGNTTTYKVEITYPDSSSYWFSMQNNNGNGGWSENYDENRFIAGDTLRDVLIEKAPKESFPGKVVFIILLLGIGVFNMVSPHTAWYLEYGWRYKNAEPSDLALGLNRVGGVFAIIVAIILIFV
jgi:hypothetical protein